MSDDSRKNTFKASGSQGESFTFSTVSASFGNMSFTDTEGQNYNLHDVNVPRIMCAVEGLVDVDVGTNFKWQKESCDFTVEAADAKLSQWQEFWSGVSASVRAVHAFAREVLISVIFCL